MTDPTKKLTDAEKQALVEWIIAVVEETAGKRSPFVVRRDRLTKAIREKLGLPKTDGAK
jgi:hypothetical protein